MTWKKAGPYIVAWGLALLVLAVLFFSGCGPVKPGPQPTPTPTPPVTTTTTTTTTTLPAEPQCGAPAPGPVTVMAVKIHIQGPNWTTIDASPLVGKALTCGRDWDYCRLIGFTDGRGFCPPRPEGSPEKGDCDKAVTGGGLVWTWNGRVISPSIPGIPDDHEARIDPIGGWMLQVKPGKGGVARACSKLASGCWDGTRRMDCGEVILP